MPLRPPSRASRRTGLLTVATTAALLGGLLAPAPGAASAAPEPAAPVTGPAPAPGCRTPLFDAPLRAATARRTAPRAFARAAEATDGSPVVPDLDRLAADPTVWLDRCGAPFYVEPARVDGSPAPTAPAAPSGAAGGTTGPVAPLADTFALESLPGSRHTVYLDFTGGTVSGTAWNGSYGETIAVPPYDAEEPADTAFSDSELVDVQDAWAVVAADFAAFDVNVTTRWPGQDAITRYGSGDTTWGSHVRITTGGPLYQDCGCGGMAYLDVVRLANGHATYQPAWVFADGTGYDGKGLGEAASHEVGHQFGLDHDGTDGTDGTEKQGYHLGARPWAPVMGAGYYQPVSQWSRGEYPGASNAEDDVAVIAQRAGTVPDDHGGTPATATPLAAGQSVAGRITTRADTDAFTVTVAGETRLALRLPPFSDLDASLRVLDEDGSPVALVDPPVSWVDRRRATGLDATWTATLPASGRVRTVVVDGVGHGTPGVAGAYSDYGSLGTYSLTLTTADPVEASPLSLSTADAPPAVRTEAYSARPVVAAGGTEPYRWSATGLPDGLGVAAATGELRGTPTAAGTRTVTLTVTDADGESAVTTLDLTVRHPPTAAADVTLDAVLDRPLSTRLEASGGDGTDYRWRTAPSATLPAGVSLDLDGTLAGVPTTPGTSRTDLEVTSDGSTAGVVLELRVAAPTLGLATAVTGLPTATVGRRYRGVVRATGAQGALTWERVRGGLPRGLRWRPGLGARVVVEGRARAVQRRVLVLRVTDEAGGRAQRRFVVRSVR